MRRLFGSLRFASFGFHTHVWNADCYPPACESCGRTIAGIRGFGRY